MDGAPREGAAAPDFELPPRPADGPAPAPLERLEIGGLSIGGIETCIDLPTWKLAFDIGRCPPEVVSRPTILFTHGHMDHMGGIAWHCATRALRHMQPPVYVVPRAKAEAVAELFAAWRRLDRSDLPHELVPLCPGEEHRLENGLVARPFAAAHGVPAQGYGLWRRRKKLDPRYAGLDSRRIQELVVGQGVEVSRIVETPELAFTGDTRIEVLEREEVVRTARVLVMEVTFVDDRVTVEQARAKGHVHLYELAERAEMFENEALVLTHFSSRYTRSEILAALDRELPPDLRARTHPLLAGHRLP